MRGEGKSGVVALLVQAGADVNAADENGMTPLMAAARGKADAKTVQLLREAGANLDAKNKEGRTALDIVKQSNGAEELYE
jgi:ankyrin repeat protein